MLPRMSTHVEVSMKDESVCRRLCKAAKAVHVITSVSLRVHRVKLKKNIQRNKDNFHLVCTDGFHDLSSINEKVPSINVYANLMGKTGNSVTLTLTLDAKSASY